MPRDPIAIIGAGQAGAALAERLRHKGYDGAIALFGQEPCQPYQRPPLSKKYLGGEWDFNRLALRPAAHWQELGVDIVTSATVTAIDPAQKTLTVGGQTLRWSKLALTTGAAPRRLPDGLRGLAGVYEMRTLANADALKADFRSGRRLLVLGGGYIGLETAAVAAKAGLDVCVIEQAPRILQRVACEQTASLIRDLHRQHGVRILEGRCVIRFIGTDRFTALALDDGTQLEADLIVVGIGVLPCTGLAQDSGLKCDNGIRVDLYGRSSAPDIWAAGDCANFPYQGIPTRLESVPNAVEQAECAADDMLSLSRPYQPIPWFWSDQYDMKLQIVGLNRGYDRVLPVPSERGHSLWYFRDGRMIAVDALNDARAFMAAKRLFEKDITLTLEEASADGFDPVAWVLQALKKG